jgi:beta-galactosidase
MKNSTWIFLLLAAFTAVSARDRIPLNRSWNFTPGYEVRKSVYTEVNLPHTWNLDALSGKEDYFRGLGNYEKTVDIPTEWSGKAIYLRFKGVNSVANVFVNGRHAGEHRGGYTAFTFDISSYLEYGKQNKLWVRVSNAPQLDVMPLVGDFNMYGGIYRDVELIVADPNHISLTAYASSGVYLKQKTVNKEFALLEAKVLLTGNPDEKAILKMQVKDNQQHIISEQQQSLTLTGEKLQPVLFSFNIKKPHLWQGTEDPYLYSVETKLIRENKIIDEVTERIGFRSYTVDADQGFFLNGKPLQLRGVCRHQDREGLGNAIYPVHHKEDIDIIREMGANAIRLSHYPQDKYIYDLCDEYGIILWSEIPFVGPGGYRDKGYVDQLSFRENGKKQLLEMLHQNYNHPSILFWGLFNELKTEGDNPAEYLKELKELVAKTDPTRLTVAATYNESEFNRIPDMIAWNQYFGWYGGEPAAIGDWADKTHRKYSGIPIGISEYGAGASVYHQEEDLKKPNANTYWHPENWQAYFHEEHWKAIAQRPFLWGTFVWVMFDFGAAHRSEGEVKGKNDKGLVTFDRKVRKDAFYFYKANWNTTDPFVRIAGKHMNKRTKMLQTIKIYSNQAEVELFVNGKSLGKKRGRYGIFLWDNVSLSQGENRLKAIANKIITDDFQLTVNNF